jgi:hypothetical protein
MMRKNNHTIAGWKRRRDFPVVRVALGDGFMKAAQITCAQCAATLEYAGSRGHQDNETYFVRHGWLVGGQADRDYCPACARKALSRGGRLKALADLSNVLESKGEIMSAKVVELPPQASREMSREDGRLLSRAIEDHWDEATTGYQIGWSDKRIADDMSVSIDWVRGIRERDFGGTGDEPGLALFLAEQVSVKREIGELSTLLGMAEKDLSAGTMFQTELARKMDGYRNGHRRLLDRVEKMDALALQLQGKKP